jgi:hypothetical protein
MAARNFNGTQINQSVTIVETAGADIKDVRNRIMTYDEDGNVVLASAGTSIPAGIAIIEAGINDISGAESGKVASGDDVDIQIKDIGYVLAGDAITKGQEVTADANGLAVPAKTGEYVAGLALNSTEKDGYCRVQISRYQKN